MADKIKLVQGDSRPQIQVTLTDEGTGAVIDVTGATCRMKFRASGSATVLDTLVAAPLNAALGQIVFNWNPTSLTQPPGDYQGEIEITFSNGDIQTVYEVLKFKLREDF